ncbi:MAG: hypothetical protein AB1483_07850 [Candidatus Zixiibacteriota bacterium]
MVRRQTDVFEVSSGLARLGWKAVRSLYYRGASDGMFGKLYKGIRGRADYNRPGLTLNALAGGIRPAILNSQDTVVVAHPTLVAILRGHRDLVYQHGEVVAPDESIVKGANYVLVPTDTVAKSFVAGGYDESRVIVTGLCIEPSLVRVARESFEARVLRINGQGPLTGAFFSSGAEPKTHVKSLVAAAVYAANSGGRAILFARRGGFFQQYAAAKFGESRIQYMSVGSADGLPSELPEAMVVLYESRRELNAFTTSLFRYFDYFVSPSHERTNWALGLGLPMFVVGPCYGPFAPQNRDILLKSGVADVLDTPVSAVGFGDKLTAMRQHGVLSDMAHAGIGKFDINGFEKAAEFLTAE